MHFEGSWIRSLIIGCCSGVALYLIFVVGKVVIIILQLPFINQIQALYETVNPTLWWHYIVLFCVIIPGEELFWRGLIQQRLSYLIKPEQAIFAGAILYASAHIYAGNIVLVLASLIGGIIWGSLYVWKRNMVLLISSHIIFDLFLVILFPLS